MSALHSIRTMILCLGTLVALAPGAAFVPRSALAQAQSGLVAFSSAPLSIRTGEGKTHRFKVEIARTPEERAQGLMFRRVMAPDAGMLFDFGRTEPVAMWMKNTLIPLDMLFVGADGAVVNIAQRTVPQSLTPIPSARPVRFVLELPGGTAARLGLKPGDKLLHPLFGTEP
jgi:uncharacterized membrane protein (UPF0127 family)